MTNLTGRRGSTEKGAALVKQTMLVRIQSSALEFLILHFQLSIKKTRLVSVPESTTVFETVRPGSIPGRVTLFSECAGFARDFAKVVDQVQFLARTLGSL